MMEMDKFNADWWPLKEFREQQEMGRLNLSPAYQRSRVWTDEQRYSLIESVSQGFPIGLVMLNVIDSVEDDVPIKHFDVVDGQQRIRTLLEYMTGSEEWATVTTRNEFQPFAKLKIAVQKNFYSYKVPIALMTKFDDEEINEIFTRLQEGKPLKPGEKLKSMTAASLYATIRSIADNEIFELSDSALKIRDSHWMLATAFFKAGYTDEVFGRMEYQNLHKFLKDANFDSRKAIRTVEAVRKVLNFEQKVITDAIEIWPKFASYARTARVVKWLFFALWKMLDDYALSGKERDAAEGVVHYYKAIEVERSAEWTDYLNAGRTGRVDTEAVKACIAELSNKILNYSGAEPKDPQRNFTKEQREEILDTAGRKCAGCGTSLSKSNYHADHKHPHSKGGKTTLSNGRALCSDCNRRLGNKWRDNFGLAAPSS